MSNPPKILFITWNFPPKIGGMENLCFNLFTRLSQESRVEVIAPFCRLDAVDAPIHRPFIPGLAPFFQYALLKGRKILAAQEPCVMLGGSLLVAPVLSILKRRFPVRCVALAHGLDVIFPHRFYQLLLRFALPRLDAVICNSSHTKGLFQSRFPDMPSEVIPPLVDFERFAGPVEPIFPGSYLLSVGRLTERKGLIPFVRYCFSSLVQELADLHLLIVGTDPLDAVAHKGGYQRELVRCVEESGLQGRIFLLGSVPERVLISLYQHCEAVVFPVIAVAGDVEGFGMVALEAAAAGKPVVAFKEGGIADAVLEGVTGALLAPGDYEGMRRVLAAVVMKQKRFPMARTQTAEAYGWGASRGKFRRLIFDD
jgi:phosphatidyl-myo-inositol dimannoside synthase